MSYGTYPIDTSPPYCRCLLPTLSVIVVKTATMSSEEHKEQEEGEEVQQHRQQYPESPQTDTWNKDVGETGRWGSLSRKELFLVAGAVLVIVGATLAGVLVGAKNGDSDEPVGVTKADPATGKQVSAYELPVPPPPTIVSDQMELEYLRDKLAGDAVMNKYLSVIPQSTAELAGVMDDPTADPYARAASWLVTADTFNSREAAVTRFALAAVYYVTGGQTWTDSTNWLSGTANHCDWYGISCCQEVFASTRCTSTDFDGVIEIDLHQNNLAGPIPDSFALFPELVTLFLSSNAITGTFSGTVFASLSQFQKLYLQYNKLTGEIPVELNTNGIFGKSLSLAFVFAH